MEALRACDPEAVYLLINCEGGDGDAVYYTCEQIGRLALPVVAYNCGTVNSAANLLYLAADADRRFMLTDRCSFKIHEASRRLKEQQLESREIGLGDAYAAYMALNWLNHQIAAVYAQRTLLCERNPDQIFELLFTGISTYVGHEACKFGFAHSVKPLPNPFISTYVPLTMGG